MRLSVPTALLLLALAGCSQEPSLHDAPSAAPDPGPTHALPAHTLPATARDGWAECPYLGAEWVAQTNGQRVTGLGTDTHFEPPARQFWSTAEEPQLTVIVR